MPVNLKAYKSSCSLNLSAMSTLEDFINASLRFNNAIHGKGTAKYCEEKHCNSKGHGPAVVKHNDATKRFKRILKKL